MASGNKLNYQAYISALQKNVNTKKSTEHTHRPAFTSLIESYHNTIHSLNDPKGETYGRVDFVIESNNVPVGYIETKDIYVNLSKEEDKEQIVRYRNALDNFILTNYLEFRWYFKGKLKINAQLATIDSKNKISITKNITEIHELFENFFNAKTITIKTSEELAKKMASSAKLIKEIIHKILLAKKDPSNLISQYNAFKEILMPDLDKEKYADMYAQTVVYGLFSARCVCKEKDFSREKATYLLPKTNPFLRKAFGEIAGPDLDEEAIWVVDELVEVLKSADSDSIVKYFIQKGKNGDPVLDFYEGFLREYNPKLKLDRGVFYTPKPVLSYIAKSIDKILKNRFGIHAGLADKSKITKISKKTGEQIETHKVIVLDPASGTGGFLQEIVSLIHDYFKSNMGYWTEYVTLHLLPRIFGFEILMAPYTIAHMKLGMKLIETGYNTTTSDQRLNIFLTNTLSQLPREVFKHHFAEWLAEESREAGEVKKEKPVMVILGNPPYKAESANKSEWIAKLLRGFDTDENQKTSSYFEINGNPLNEKNPKWLNDDYVKFIRFAQRRIEMTGYGVIGFITNHGFIDNPTFRGMRESLLKDFDYIYILDCHGNIKKNEKCPNGDKDEGIFDIKQGVSINFFIKNDEVNKNSIAKVFHADLWGEREIFSDHEKQLLDGGKYHWLLNNDIDSTSWNEIIPKQPYYYFSPQKNTHDEEYDHFISLEEIFNEKSVGVTTARDNFCISWSSNELWAKIKKFINLDIETARSEFTLREDVRDWKVSFAQKDLQLSGPKKSNIVKINYRPLDLRYTYYTGKSRGFLCNPRNNIMKNFIKNENYGLISSRMTKGENFNHSWISNDIIEGAFLSPLTSNNAFMFPVYIFKSKESNLPKISNLKSTFLTLIEKEIDLKFSDTQKSDLKKYFGSDDCIGYIYAILNLQEYRTRYNYRLQKDFPRIPIPFSKKFFVELSKLGNDLINIHLMNDSTAGNTKFPIEGDRKIDILKYDDRSKLYINDNQYFENILPEVWNFMIGGYKVCEKWLKSRKGRILSFEELEHFDGMVGTINKTISIQKKLSSIFDSFGETVFQQLAKATHHLSVLEKGDQAQKKHSLKKRKKSRK